MTRTLAIRYGWYALCYAVLVQVGVAFVLGYESLQELWGL